MPLTISPERAILLTKLSVAFACSWPPSFNSTKTIIAAYELLWHVLFINTWLLFYALVVSFYEYRNDPIIMTQSMCASSACIQVTIKMALCRLHRFRLQALIFDMEQFCTNANDEEKNVLRCYIDRYKLLHGCFISWSYTTGVAFICGPIFLPQSFPTFAIYPFPVEQHPTRGIIYFHQSIVALQAAAGINVDCQVALLIWYLTARFEILGTKIRNISNEKQFNECINAHHQLLRYARELHQAVYLVVLSTVAMTTVSVVFGSINLIGQSVPIKAQYSTVILTGIVTLFMCALPADRLMNMSFNVSYDIYFSNWYERNVKLQKNVLQLIMRAQKPVTIEISGILPVLSLNYYLSFLYTSFSYFTAVRVMLTRNEIE